MKLLVYDGTCNMCSQFIRFIVKFNKNEELRITSFNSNWYHNNIHEKYNRDSILYISKEKTYTHSDAIINLLADINLIFIPLKILKFFPKVIRNSIYNYISINRYNFLKNSICVLHHKNSNKIFL